MSEGQELVRRDPRAPIDAVLGTGDIRMMIQQAQENVAVAIEIARDRGFVTDFEVKDKNNRVTGTRAFFHLATWQLLGQSWGLTAFTEGTPEEVKAGVWQAAAVAANVQDGRIIGRAVALCSRNEPGKKYKGDHDLAATAQSRAQRNALRSCLGSILIAAGFDFADPDAPATKEQIAVLHQLERELELTHDQAHAEAGVSSFKDLTREQAAELIDEWTARRDGPAGRQDSDQAAGRDSAPVAATPAPSDSDVGEGDDRPGSVPPPANAWEAYQRANAEASFSLGADGAASLVRKFWRDRKLGPPRESWDEEQLAELAQLLRGAAEAEQQQSLGVAP